MNKFKNDKENTIVDYFCKSCQKRLKKGLKKCPYCGLDERDVSIIIKEKVSIKESSFRIRLKRIGYKKFAYELIKRLKKSVSKKLPEGVYEIRIINKIANLYQQAVYKIKNGELHKITHKENENLTDHKLKNID